MRQVFANASRWALRRRTRGFSAPKGHADGARAKVLACSQVTNKDAQLACATAAAAAAARSTPSALGDGWGDGSSTAAELFAAVAERLGFKGMSAVATSRCSSSRRAMRSTCGICGVGCGRGCAEPARCWRRTSSSLQS